VIIGTAGHIDHGKTALVRALTGVDTDRLPEEKARGITIDLGYAYQPLPDGEVIGFIDVPGHEKLVHTMVAGATGIDYALLVVAANEGPMPQTREHVQVLDLLGLSQGAVALTKIDRVAPSRLAAAQAEVASLLAGTRLAGLPVFPVSAITGTGLAELGAWLAAAPRNHRQGEVERRCRLAVDRSFTLPGIGTLVTGTLYNGQVRAGDRLLLSPAGREVRVRGLRAQDRPAEVGLAGQRCALNLTAPQLHHEDIHRGDWILDPALHFPSDRLSAELRLLAAEDQPLRHWTQVHLHLGAAHVMARVGLLEGETLAPGQSALVDLVLERPLAALNGDLCILRDQSARRTLGRARLLDLAPPNRGRRKPQRLAWLGAMAAQPPLAALPQALDQAPQGVNLDLFTAQWNLDPSAVAVLAATGLTETVALATSGSTILFSRRHWDEWRGKVLSALAAEHARSPDYLGPDRERLRRLAASSLARPLFGCLVDGLIADGEVALTGPWLHLPGRTLSLNPAEEALWRGILAPRLHASPFNPPRVRDLARAGDLEEEEVRRLLKRLVGMGEVFQVAKDHFFTREAVARLAAIAANLAQAEGSATAASFRDRIGTGRKVAIHILEFFDRLGFTRRIGDEHRVYSDSLLDLTNAPPNQVQSAGFSPAWPTRPMPSGS